MLDGFKAYFSKSLVKAEGRLCHVIGNLSGCDAIIPSHFTDDRCVEGRRRASCLWPGGLSASWASEPASFSSSLILVWLVCSHLLPVPGE